MTLTSVPPVDPTTMLPRSCPDWCAQGAAGHRQALEEGCTVEQSSVHVSGDFGYILNDIVNPIAKRVDRAGGAAWEIETRADGSDPRWCGYPVVQLSVRDQSERDGIDLNLNSGEARILARQLTHLADQIDLHS